MDELMSGKQRRSEGKDVEGPQIIVCRKKEKKNQNAQMFLHCKIIFIIFAAWIM